MTKNNEQIIIDGVDVSGCIHHEEEFEEDEDIKIKNFCALWYNSCHSCNNHNCYYKMYSRKEQECEELTSKCSQLEEKLEKAKGLAMLRRECLEAVKELANNANLPNISLYIDSFLNEEPQKINEVIDEKKHK